MTLHFWCIVAAWAVVYLTKAPVALAMQRSGGYDNHHPRTQQAGLTGWGARALAAHQNGFETFAPFAAAVLVAHLAGGSSALVDGLSLAFVLSRVAYVGFYIGNFATLRSAVWGVGWLATGGLFLSPLL